MNRNEKRRLERDITKNIQWKQNGEQQELFIVIERILKQVLYDPLQNTEGLLYFCIFCFFYNELIMMSTDMMWDYQINEPNISEERKEKILKGKQLCKTDDYFNKSISVYEKLFAIEFPDKVVKSSEFIIYMESILIAKRGTNEGDYLNTSFFLFLHEHLGYEWNNLNEYIPYVKKVLSDKALEITNAINK